MSNFKYAYKPGFSPQDKAKRFAAQYYAQANQRQKRRIDFRRNIAGMPPLATRGFGSQNFVANRERKFFDINTATYQVNTTGSFTLLHIPTLGSDFTNRIGRKTMLKSLYIRGYLNLEAAANPSTPVAVAAQQLRLIIFCDNQPNGAAPAVTDLLKEALPSSQLNANNRDRFKIIKDKTYVFDPFLVSTTASQAIATNSRTIADIKIYKKLAVETIFNGTNGGTIGDINSGAVYMFWIGSFAAGAGDSNAIVSTRVRFDDS